MSRRKVVLPIKVENADFYRYLFLAEKVSKLRMQAALTEKEQAELSSFIQKKYNLTELDTLDESGNIKRAQKEESVSESQTRKAI